jgi:hypothetical protein
MYDTEYLGHYDLDGDVTLTIDGVDVEDITAPGGSKERMPVVSFEDARKKLILNKTNGKTIAGLHGNDTDGWIGKKVTLFRTTTTFAGEEVECIRVRK